MGLSSFFKFFRRKPKWNGTPEMFLALVMEFAKTDEPVANPNLRLAYIGDALLKIMKVNLHPYQGIEELVILGKPDYTLVNKAKKMMQDRADRIELKKAIYGQHVDLGDEDLLTSNAEGARFAREFVNEFSRYVKLEENAGKETPE